MLASEREELSRRMARLADGDRRELAFVFKAAWPVVRQFAARSLARSARGDADDVAQLALMTIFARASEYDPEKDALAWMLAVTAWQVRTAKKKTERRREDFAPHEGTDTARSPEDALIARDLEAAAIEVLGTLGPKDRETILAATEERARPDISPATFRKRVQRAMDRLREAWRAKHGVE